ncbi:MAG: hypothetical protein H7122_20830 [Chitinophagaceae bacterium]|nr:hypothetical protein [Chitinophagaceae bacterium]
MISKYDAPRLIKNEIPQIADGLYRNTVTNDIYKSVQCLSECTKNAVLAHDYNLSKKCFKLAERLYNNGDVIIKSVIENCFIYSFSSFMPTDKIERMIVKSIIPGPFYNIYLKQVMQSGS